MLRAQCFCDFVRAHLLNFLQTLFGFTLVAHLLVNAANRVDAGTLKSLHS